MDAKHYHERRDRIPYSMQCRSTPGSLGDIPTSDDSPPRPYIRPDTVRSVLSSQQNLLLLRSQTPQLLPGATTASVAYSRVRHHEKESSVLLSSHRVQSAQDLRRSRTPMNSFDVTRCERNALALRDMRTDFDKQPNLTGPCNSRSYAATSSSRLHPSSQKHPRTFGNDRTTHVVVPQRASCARQTEREDARTNHLSLPPPTSFAPHSVVEAHQRRRLPVAPPGCGSSREERRGGEESSVARDLRELKLGVDGSDSNSVESQKESGYHSDGEGVEGGGGGSGAGVSERTHGGEAGVRGMRVRNESGYNEDCVFMENDAYRQKTMSSVQPPCPADKRLLTPAELSREYFLRGEAEMETYEQLLESLERTAGGRDEPGVRSNAARSSAGNQTTQDVLQAVIAHINDAITYYKEAMSVVGTTTDNAIRLRTKYNTALLRRRRLLKRYAMTAVQADLTRPDPVVTQKHRAEERIRRPAARVDLDEPCSTVQKQHAQKTKRSVTTLVDYGMNYPITEKYSANGTNYSSRSDDVQRRKTSDDGFLSVIRRDVCEAEFVSKDNLKLNHRNNECDHPAEACTKLGVVQTAAEHENQRGGEEYGERYGEQRGKQYGRQHREERREQNGDQRGGQYRGENGKQLRDLLRIQHGEENGKQRRVQDREAHRIQHGEPRGVQHGEPHRIQHGEEKGERHRERYCEQRNDEPYSKNLSRSGTCLYSNNLTRCNPSTSLYSDSRTCSSTGLHFDSRSNSNTGLHSDSGSNSGTRLYSDSRSNSNTRLYSDSRDSDSTRYESSAAKSRRTGMGEDAGLSDRHEEEGGLRDRSQGRWNPADAANVARSAAQLYGTLPKKHRLTVKVALDHNFEVEDRDACVMENGHASCYDSDRYNLVSLV